MRTAAIVLKLVARAIFSLMAVVTCLLMFYTMESSFRLIAQLQWNQWLIAASLLTSVLTLCVIVNSMVLVIDGYLKDEPYALNGDYDELRVRLWMSLIFTSLLALCEFTICAGMTVAAIMFDWGIKYVPVYAITCVLTLAYSSPTLWSLHYRIRLLSDSKYKPVGSIR